MYTANNKLSVKQDRYLESGYIQVFSGDFTSRALQEKFTLEVPSIADFRFSLNLGKGSMQCVLWINTEGKSIHMGNDTIRSDKTDEAVIITLNENGTLLRKRYFNLSFYYSDLKMVKTGTST